MQYSLTENLSKFRPFGGGSRVTGHLAEILRPVNQWIMDYCIKTDQTNS